MKTIEDKVVFTINGIEYDLSTLELNTFNPDNDNPLCFSLDTETDSVAFTLNLSETTVNGSKLYSFNITKISIIDANVNVNLTGKGSSWTGCAYQEYKTNDADSEYKHVIEMDTQPYQGNSQIFKVI